MVTLSEDKTFRRVRMPSLQERNSVSYQVRVAGGFAFLYNSLGEYKRLFPVKTPASISFKILGDVAIFIVADPSTTSAIVFNLLTSTLQHTELDTSSFPSITEKGVFYSREGQIIYREYLSSKDTLGEEQILASLPGEYLAYAFEEQLVTKLIDNSIIKHEGDCTRIPLEVVWN